MKEITLLDEFHHLFRYWWLVTLCMLVGGGAGYLFHLTNPPVYEAKATIMAIIDLKTFPFKNVREDLIQYNEDMALGTIEGALRSIGVTQSLFIAAQSQGIELDAKTLARNSTIERRHDIWELRYRSSNPATSQIIANLWMEIGFETMQNWQTDKLIPQFVILDQPTPAYLPDTPIAYQLSTLLLAGSLAGFIIGLIITNLLPRDHNRHQ